MKETRTKIGPKLASLPSERKSPFIATKPSLVLNTAKMKARRDANLAAFRAQRLAEKLNDSLLEEDQLEETRRKLLVSQAAADILKKRVNTMNDVESA